LIVAPLSTLAHWCREFSRWTDLNTIVYHGSAEDRKLIRIHEFAYSCDRPASNDVCFNQIYLKKCMKGVTSKSESPWMVDVVITSPEMLLCDDCSELCVIEWEALVVDEAHRMKNHNSKLAHKLRGDKFIFKYKMLLTGYVCFALHDIFFVSRKEKSHFDMF
jgi:SNF2 family DNA or RNA helicase